LSLEEVKKGPRVIGTKQVKKAISRGLTPKVFIAGDAEPHITEPIRQLCFQHGVEVEMVESMQKLGDACGIDVGSATVALLNE
jgi:large subunit ribosomal protein L7A